MWTAAPPSASLVTSSPVAAATSGGPALNSAAPSTITTKSMSGAVERAVAGTRAHDHRHRGHHALEAHQRLQVVRRVRVALERVLRSLPRAFEQHHQRDALLERELGQPVSLRVGPDPDRPTHHREVLGADQHRSTVDGAVPGDETVGGRVRGHAPPDTARLDADLTERARVDERLDSRPGVEPSAIVLAGEPLGPAHRRGRLPPRREILEQRVPVVHRARGQLGGDDVGVMVPTAEVRLQHPRPLQVEVHVDLPREAHAAEDLRGGPTVAHRGLAREELRPADGPVRARRSPGRRAHTPRHGPRRGPARCARPCRRRGASSPGTSRSGGRTARAPVRSRRRAPSGGRPCRRSTPR